VTLIGEEIARLSRGTAAAADAARWVVKVPAA